MKTNLRRLIITAVVLAVAAAPGANVYATSSLEDYSDEFDSPTLDPKWTFENPAPNPEGQSWSLASNPGFLTMTTTGPTDLREWINTAPRMLQDSPEGNFSITVRVLADPDVLYEHAGILVIASPTSWVRLVRTSGAVSLVTGPSAKGALVLFSGSDVVLKLTKLGSTYHGAFSTDGGESFTSVGQVQGPAGPVNIGLAVVSTPDDNVFTADFDYFRVEQNLAPSMTFSLQVLLALVLIMSTTLIVWLRRRRAVRP